MGESHAYGRAELYLHGGSRATIRAIDSGLGDVVEVQPLAVVNIELVEQRLDLRELLPAYVRVACTRFLVSSFASNAVIAETEHGRNMGEFTQEWGNLR